MNAQQLAEYLEQQAKLLADHVDKGEPITPHDTNYLVGVLRTAAQHARQVHDRTSTQMGPIQITCDEAIRLARQYLRGRVISPDEVKALAAFTVCHAPAHERKEVTRA